MVEYYEIIGVTFIAVSLFLALYRSRKEKRVYGKKPISVFIRKYSEYLTLPISIVLWYFTPYIIWQIDPQAGSHDLGIFQAFLLATVGLFFGVSIVWFLLRVGSPDTAQALDDYIQKNIEGLTAWQKGIFVLVYYFGLLFVWVWLVSIFV